MPRGDRTGPWGLGPRTGRAAGYCAGYDVPGFANPIFRFGGRGGFGGGRGYRHMYYATGLPGWARYGYGPYDAQPYLPEFTKEQELEYLKKQQQGFQKAIENIQKQIDALSTKKSKE